MVESRKLLLLGLVFAVLIFIISVIYKKYIYNDDVLITLERVRGEYTLVDFERSSSGVYATLMENNTGMEYDTFVSKECPMLDQKISDGKVSELNLVRFTNIETESRVTSYSFDGLYQQLCTNMGFDVNKKGRFYSH